MKELGLSEIAQISGAPAIGWARFQKMFGADSVDQIQKMIESGII